MNDDETLALIRAALTEVAPTRADEFATVPLSKNIQELQLDSISTMEMVGFIEEKVQTTFPDEELAKVGKLADLADLIRAGRVGAA